jgi:hypothetical protein
MDRSPPDFCSVNLLVGDIVGTPETPKKGLCLTQGRFHGGALLTFCINSA